MIRVCIVADLSDRADALASLLEEDERFEASELELADVILTAGIPLRRVPLHGKPVVGISTEADEDAPFDDALRAWLPADAGVREITAALAAAANGFTVLTRQQTWRTFRPISILADTASDREQLTSREQEVLQLMAIGYGNKEIAAHLRISTNTSKFHVRQILAKLNSESRTEAVATAIRRGLIPI